MKLIIFIPCYNEEKTLPEILDNIPKKLDGISNIEVLIIDDGSTDHTTKIARKYENVNVIRHRTNRGLAEAFNTAVEYSISNRADILTNLDGDNQYKINHIQKIIDPIIKENFDFVIGDRQVKKIPHFSKTKKILHKLGTSFINLFLDRKISDPPSGMRAYSSLALNNLIVMNKFSYTLETLFHADYLKLSICEVLIETNPPTRESRLFRSNFQYLFKSISALFSILVYYKSTLLINILSIPFYFLG